MQEANPGHWRSILDFPIPIKNSIAAFFLEELISHGASRQVYAHPYDDTVVIKIEYARTHNNAMEWNIWNVVKYTELSKWFAPCVAISDDGVVLVQKKTSPAKRYPEKMPNFFTDFKRQNYGMYNGKFVCHDYAGILFEKGITNRMAKVEWWDYNPS